MWVSKLRAHPGSPCGATSGFCRQVPDVAASSDPNTGYLIYWNGSHSDLTSAAGWQSIGGTSAAAPVWAALLAVVNASSGCHSSPIGFANPALYRAAGEDGVFCYTFFKATGRRMTQ